MLLQCILAFSRRLLECQNIILRETYSGCSLWGSDDIVSQTHKYVSDFLVYYVGADHLPYTRAKLGIAIFFRSILRKDHKVFAPKPRTILSFSPSPTFTPYTPEYIRHRNTEYSVDRQWSMGWLLVPTPAMANLEINWSPPQWQAQGRCTCPVPVFPSPACRLDIDNGYHYIKWCPHLCVLIGQITNDADLWHPGDLAGAPFPIRLVFPATAQPPRDLAIKSHAKSQSRVSAYRAAPFFIFSAASTSAREPR